MKFGNQSRFWFFNGLMLWGVGLGWIIGTSAINIQDTISHKGPGFVLYGDDERSPERLEKVPESQYKRHNYTMSGMMLGLGLLVWIVVAKAARDNIAKVEAKEAYLEAQIQKAAAYHHAFASTIDKLTREHATAEALLSAEFQVAKRNEELASSVFYAASKKAKGDAE